MGLPIENFAQIISTRNNGLMTMNNSNADVKSKHRLNTLYTMISVLVRFLPPNGYGVFQSLHTAGLL